MDSKPKKLYKKWWFWIIVLIVLGGIAGIKGDKDKKADNKSASTTAVVKKEETKKDEKKEEPKKAETLADLVAKNLQDGKVTSEGKALTIEFKGSDFSENMFVEGGLNDIRKCFKGIYKNEQFKQFDTINVKVMCELTDQYGKKSPAAGMSLIFDQNELQKVQDFDNITIDQLVTLQGQHRTGLSGAIKKGLSDKNIKMLYPN